MSEWRDETLIHETSNVAEVPLPEELVVATLELVRETTPEIFAQKLLVQVEAQARGVARSIFFACEESGQLRPLAKRNSRSGSPFHIVKTLLKKSVRMGLVQMRTSDGQGQPQIIVIPMIAGDRVVGVLHIEGCLTNLGVQWASRLAALCAPRLETMMVMHDLNDWMTQAIETITAAVEAKDTYTAGHSERVARFTLAIAAELDMSKAERKALATSALCHDIGKIGIPDAILKKPALLSIEEYEDIKHHPAIGIDILKKFSLNEDVKSGVLYHHEKWDGSGYPYGLAGEDIPEFARIIGIADALDAMTSGRSYSGFMDEHAAIERLCELDDLFEPRLLQAMLRASQNGRLSMRTGTQVR